MMLKFLPLTALALSLSGGVALADRGGHRGASEHYDHNVVVRDHHERGGGAVVYRDHRGFDGRSRFDGGARWNGGGRVYVRNEPRFQRIDRHPIFVSRPVIRERYYNYYRRPALIVESYNTMPGYYWVAGRWTWDGYEWIWQPGHYQPDPSYIDQGYDGY